MLSIMNKITQTVHKYHMVIVNIKTTTFEQPERKFQMYLSSLKGDWDESFAVSNLFLILKLSGHDVTFIIKY